MRVQILDEAEQDLVEGCRFYEAQERGLGNYFLDTLYSDVDSLQLYAGIHPKMSGYYRMLSKRFPFAIYYRIDSKIVRVRAILDCRRDPELIDSRLK